MNFSTINVDDTEIKALNIYTPNSLLVSKNSTTEKKGYFIKNWHINLFLLFIFPVTWQLYRHMQATSGCIWNLADEKEEKQ